MSHVHPRLLAAHTTTEHTVTHKGAYIGLSSPPHVPRGPRLPLYRPSAPSSGPLRASLPRDPAATLVRPHARHRTLSRRSCHPGGSDLSRETDAFGHATPIRAHELASCDDLAHRSAGRRTAGGGAGAGADSAILYPSTLMSVGVLSDRNDKLNG